MVAVSSGAATTVLSDVDECSTGKRKRRKRSLVEEQPFAPDLEVILPSRYIIFRAWGMYKWQMQVDGEKSRVNKNPCGRHLLLVPQHGKSH